MAGQTFLIMGVMLIAAAAAPALSVSRSVWITYSDMIDLMWTHAICTEAL